ncbi:MAG: hypothetical protein LCH41_01510 [Armatimonadetes bacterium]|nr:hypothetical protein [Armatimonadota bacterium]
MNTRRNKGFSLAEMMISSVVLVTVITLSLNVMLATAKVSRGVIMDSDRGDGSRIAAESIRADAETAVAALSRVTIGGTTYSANEDTTLILARYRLDASGAIIPDNRTITVYRRESRPEGNFNLWEIEARQILGMRGVQTSRRKIAENITRFHYRLARHETLNPIGSNYGSPVNLVTGEPSGNTGRLTVVRAEWRGRTISDDSDGPTDLQRPIPVMDGLNAGDLARIGMVRTGNSLAFSDGVATGPIDVLIEIDERFGTAPNYETRANQLTCWIVGVQRTESGDRELARQIASNLRNAQ